MGKTCLVFLAEGFEEIETVTPVDIFRRAGMEVTVASLDAKTAVMGRSNITVLADCTLDSVASRDFDCVFCPGGPGTKLLREDQRVLDIVAKHFSAGKCVTAICAAPTVLDAAGILSGKKYTAHFSVAETLKEISAAKVVVDGTVITSKGAGTSVEFALAVVKLVVGAEDAEKVAKAIEFSS
mmetsp:Transcript_21760/g.52373  ORF Transcript_21760/g.52373 Transcript_21760/m.52373 type:complete len:182 (+) Transcript_21760:24-569(+)